MAGCPPGQILNPKTLRCVSARGDVARELLRDGYISAANIATALAYAPAPVARAKAVGGPAGVAGEAPLAAAFGFAPARAKKPGPALAYGAAAPPPMMAAAPVLAVMEPCPPGYERNPVTGRCIRVGGRTFKHLAAAAAPPPPPPPMAGAAATNGPAAAPLGLAEPAPLVDRAGILNWLRTCQNKKDPITDDVFATLPDVDLQKLVRLHDGTCIVADHLHAQVAAQHKTGAVASIPGSGLHMTLDDFRAFRETMRRTHPTYKIPPRAYQPPPASWQLYVASDNRSGENYASILYVDVTKARMTATGPEYPVESVMVDLGFFPINVAGTMCAPSMIVELLKRLAAANKLLVPVAGGWRPATPFGNSMKYWQTDTVAKFNKFCQDLTKLLTSPI